MGRQTQSAVLHVVFLVSGFSALLYQLVWQRSLFRLFGTSMESTTLVVATFMLGLGLGSLFGGWIATRARISLPLIFGLAELGIGAFGFCSLSVFERVASVTTGISGLGIGVVSFAILLVPTVMMGATLPMLVSHGVSTSRNVGRSVGLLYFVNTLGASLGALASAAFLMGALGQSGSIKVAALLNVTVGTVVVLLYVVAPGLRNRDEVPA